MTLLQLQYFVTAVKYNSLTKAAQKLFVSQPTISLAIKSLEDEFGVPFFERNNNQLTLTKEGEYFKGLALSLLADADRVEGDMAKFTRKQEILKIGIPPMLGTFLFPPLIERFCKEHPNIEVQLSEFGSPANRQAVVNHDIDIALTVIDSPELAPELDYVKLGETSLMFCVGPTHPLSAKKKVGIPDFQNMPIILMKEDCLQSKIVERSYRKEGVSPNVRIRTNHLYTMIELLKYGDLATFLFHQVVKDRDGIVGIPMENPLKLDIVMVWNKTTTLSNISHDFMEFVKSTMKEYI